jgi:hypothetical protein
MASPRLHRHSLAGQRRAFVEQHHPHAPHRDQLVRIVADLHRPHLRPLPAMHGRARPTSVSPRVARRNEVLFSRPTAVLPLDRACMAAPTEHSVSTIDAWTPPCTSP